MATTSTLRSMESRVGRSKQRYNEKNERLVAGVVPLNADRTMVMLIQSTRRKGWVLPKGGWESDEDCPEAAAREAWEEAGILVHIEYDLGEIKEQRAPKKKASSSSTSSSSKEKDKDKEGKQSHQALYRFYQAIVTSEEVEWPEKDKRQRKWMKYSEAKEALKERPELQEALDRSTVKR